jgi:alpha-L-rhamnosidase
MLTPKNLLCEYLKEHLGLDTDRPRFSWQLTDSEHTRGQDQTAFEIEVERIELDSWDPVWSTGKVLSADSQHIVYEGDPLTGNSVCRWKVRVWNREGDAQDWSSWEGFSIGLLSEDDWRGDWIACEEAEEHQHIWFRKTITIDDVIKRAMVHIASVGYHELYVNGERIGDAVLTPGVTNLQKRVLSMTYDISASLIPGRNVLAVWTGPGWARADGSFGKGVWDQSPMFLLQAHVEENSTVCSDTSWKCKVSSSENLGLWKGGGKGTYGGELIDARLHLPNWNAVDHDDSTWSDAVLRDQDLKISAATFEPDRKVETLTPNAITPVDGGFRIDMGRNFTGWIEVLLKGGTEGDLIRIQTANREEVLVEYDQESHYIFDKTGTGTFCHRFNWMAGRWVTLLGSIAAPEPRDIKGYSITNDRKRTGTFECSNELLNTIYETDLNTYIANTVNGALMDCPHRERYGYGEVSFACMWGCGLPNFRSMAFYSKAIRDWCDVQDDDGMVNTIAPQPYLGAGGTLWSSAPVTMSWEFFRSYGDMRLLKESYPTLKKWMEYLHKAVDAKGVLMPYAKDSRFLGDWATPHGNEYGNTPEAQLFNNGVYAYNLKVMVQMANAIEEIEDANIFEQRLKALREKAHQYFFNNDEGNYVDGLQLSMVFPLYTDITPEDQRDGVFDKLLANLSEKRYFDTGSSGLPILLKYFVEGLQKPELLIPCLTRDEYPSYGNFIRRGETAWPEYWEIDGINSRIHTCYTSIAGYFIRGIGGVQPAPQSPGMKQCLIRPCFPKELEFANTTSESLHGTIACNWKRSGKGLDLTVIVPANSSARLELADFEEESISESGHSLEEADGIEVLDQSSAGTIINLQSGEYRFKLQK